MRTRDHVPTHKRLALLVGYSLIFSFALGFLVACGAPATAGPAAHRTATAQTGATATAAAQATRAAQPVLLAIQVTQQGTFAEDNAHLDVSFTVTNQTNQTIHLASPGCRIPPLVFEIHAAKQTVWASWIAESCPSNTPLDDQALTVGSTYTTTVTGDLSKVTRLGVPKLEAGVTYTVVGKLWIWHQGTLEQFIQSEVLSGNELAVSVPFTLR